MKFNLMKGPTYILFYLKIIEREKEVFTTRLENGEQIKIPYSFDQRRLPLSFRFYDPLINIIKENYKGQHKDFAKLKKSISYAFKLKHMEKSIFRTK